MKSTFSDIRSSAKAVKQRAINNFIAFRGKYKKGDKLHITDEEKATRYYK